MIKQSAFGENDHIFYIFTIKIIYYKKMESIDENGLNESEI
jgi:hypothetical protein